MGKENRSEIAAEKKSEAAVTVLRLENFLPKSVLRILLVESDDSTRQIIAALLRKCSYKVVAVGDGLKAWEFLNGKQKNIDLILTEVDLPSISGFALLTLIKEHDTCKNTPVIMMSSQDSVSTVYKCMLRGAADFLVKPVRINELRNLWQHVWRRQASDRNGPQDESLAQQKMEATAENNSVRTPSSGYVACVQRNKECIEKGSDAQSSCTKPDMEMEVVHGDNPHGVSPMQINSPEIDTNTQEVKKCIKSSRRKHDSKNSGKIHATFARGEEFYVTIKDDDVAIEGERESANIVREDCNGNAVLVKTSGEAIDFIGAFNDHSNCNFRSSGVTNKKLDSSLMLDLSLMRSHPSGSVNQASNDRHALNHSDASAFLRYINRVAQPLNSPASTCNKQRDYGNISQRHFSDQALNYNSDTHSSLLNSQKNIFSATGSSRQVEVTFPSRQQKVISIPIPGRGVRNDGRNPIHGSDVFPTEKSELSPVQIPGSAHQSNADTINSQQVYYSMDQNFNNSANQAEIYQKHKLDMSEDRMHFPSSNDRSASSSFCNGTSDHLISIGSGNNGSIDQRAGGRSVVESGNSEGPAVLSTNYQRNVQREAALNKFRLKRKERCFEKKVRYESRKKLAEQRPRVKGQFVRQAPTSVETNNQCGYLQIR